ncbi:MAG: TolC family protein [Vicinamibacterales bacterium]
MDRVQTVATSGVWVIWLCSALIVEVSAQQSLSLSLDAALDRALSESEQVRIASAGVARAQGQQTRARSELFPQLSASASYNRALASEFSGLFSPSINPTPCDAFTPDPTASVSARLAELERAVNCGATGVTTTGSDGLTDLPFGRKNTYRASLSFSQNLFSGGRIGAARDQANASRSVAEVDLASARAQVMLDVVQAYYNAALSARLVEIAEATYQQADATLSMTRLGFEAGTQPEFELLRAQVARDNQRPVVIRSQSQREIALLHLKQLLNLPPTDGVVLTTALDAAAPPAPDHLPVVATTGDVPLLTRAPERDAAFVLQQSEAAAALTRAARLPTASLTSNYEEVAYPGGVFPSFGDLRRNWTIGASVQVPVLTGGRQRADEAIARADTRQAEARLRLTRQQAAVDTRTAYEELKAAAASWDASAGTVQQAERAYQIAELRYREGVSTQLEVTDAQVLLVQAQATRAQAARDLQVARARVALLPDLPLGTSGTSGVQLSTPAVPATNQQAPSTTPARTPTSASPAASTSAVSASPGGD